MLQLAAFVNASSLSTVEKLHGPAVVKTALQRACPEEPRTSLKHVCGLRGSALQPSRRVIWNRNRQAPACSVAISDVSSCGIPGSSAVEALWVRAKKDEQVLALLRNPEWAEHRRGEAPGRAA